MGCLAISIGSLTKSFPRTAFSAKTTLVAKFLQLKMASLQIDDTQFRALADNIPTPCWMAGPDGFIFWYNRRWYAYTGTSPAEMEGWGWQSVHDPDELPKVLERWTASIASGQPFEMVFPIRGADGRFRPFLTRISPHLDAAGVVTGWFGVNTDISEQVKAENALRDSEARFRTFAQAMPNHVWTSPPDGNLDWFNDQVYQFSGAAPGELDGLGWTGIVHPDDLGAAAEGWTASLKSGTPYQCEFRLRRADGIYRWHIARALPILDEAGTLTRWIGTNTDIEEQKNTAEALAHLNDTLEARVEQRTAELLKAEESLRHSQRMESLGKLTGGVAHDFNNLLQVIGGNLQLLARDVAGNDKAERRLQNAMAGVARGAKLASQLLAFGRRQALAPQRRQYRPADPRTWTTCCAARSATRSRSRPSSPAACGTRWSIRPGRERDAQPGASMPATPWTAAAS